MMLTAIALAVVLFVLAAPLTAEAQQGGKVWQSRYPVGKLATHLLAPKTVRIAVTIRLAQVEQEGGGEHGNLTISN